MKFLLLLSVFAISSFQAQAINCQMYSCYNENTGRVCGTSFVSKNDAAARCNSTVTTITCIVRTIDADQDDCHDDI